ncbi:DNA-processing protein DprA [Thermodesulfobacteriota bacterium]
MNNYLTEDTKAIILLCGVFGKDRTENPLSHTEYSSLVNWLIRGKMRPADLLEKEYIADASNGAGIEKKRLESLLGRGVKLGFAVEEWQRNGIWIISRSDEDYPTRYKSHLKDKAPPLLFGAGDRSLLNGGGLGIVGSRNVDQDGEDFTRQVAELCAANRMPVVSGGARGVDKIAMGAALEAGGITIGILAENLLRKSIERTARYAISDGRLLLLSPYHPGARFTVGTAMARNKLIYALVDYGLVVSAEYKKGGTWAGAEEELKRDISRPVFVRIGNKVPKGNEKLMDIGTIAWPVSIELDNLGQQLSDLAGSKQNKKQQKSMSIFDYKVKRHRKKVEGANKDIHTVAEQKPGEYKVEPTEDKPGVTIYDAVLPIILRKLENAVSIEELSRSLDVNKTQLNAWLKKAVDEKKIKKLTKPVRYKKE